MACPSVRWLHFPRLSYARAWKLQQYLLERRLEGLSPGEGLGPSRKTWNNLILSLEHPHVYTLGRRADANELHFRPGGSNSNVDADVFRVDRGGKITYHGPGQLVVYPLLDLDMFKRDLHWYVDRIEQVVIDSLARFDIKAHRYKGYPGVWVGERKVAQVGMNLNKWFTTHGFAINVNPDLGYFGNMIPCGIKEKGVTSVKQLLEERERAAGIPPGTPAGAGESPGAPEVHALHEMRSNEVNCEAMLLAVKASFMDHFGLNGATVSHELMRRPSKRQAVGAGAEQDEDVSRRKAARPEGILDKAYVDEHIDIQDLIDSIRDEPLPTISENSRP